MTTSTEPVSVPVTPDEITVAAFETARTAMADVIDEVIKAARAASQFLGEGRNDRNDYERRLWALRQAVAEYTTLGRGSFENKLSEARQIYGFRVDAIQDGSRHGATA